MPLITVITPTFNTGPVLAKCMASISGQTFQDFELVIRDGVSDEETTRIIRDAAKADTRINVTSEPDKGIYDAMNKGIDQASGKWLYFLGGDDYVTGPDIFSTVAQTLTDTTADIVYGDVYFKSDLRYDGPFDSEKILTRNICHQAIFYRKQIFDQLGHYDLAFPTEADYVFNLRCWLSGFFSTQYIPIVIAYHAAGGLTSQMVDTVMAERFPAIAIDSILEGVNPWKSRVTLLAIVFRKILQRYGPGLFFSEVFKKENRGSRIRAFFWLWLSSPLRLLKKPANKL